MKLYYVLNYLGYCFWSYSVSVLKKSFFYRKAQKLSFATSAAWQNGPDKSGQDPRIIPNDASIFRSGISEYHKARSLRNSITAE
jgi:hypothetical protein